MSIQASTTGLNPHSNLKHVLTLWLLLCVPLVRASTETAACIPPTADGDASTLNLDFIDAVTVFNDLGGMGPLETPKDRLDPPILPGVASSGRVVRFANIGMHSFRFDPLHSLWFNLPCREIDVRYRWMLVNTSHSYLTGSWDPYMWYREPGYCTETCPPYDSADWQWMYCVVVFRPNCRFFMSPMTPAHGGTSSCCDINIDPTLTTSGSNISFYPT
jgi:hypothetical protein